MHACGTLCFCESCAPITVAAGHEGYLVGGAVRDLLLQQKPKDYDIVTTATPLQVRRTAPLLL